MALTPHPLVKGVAEGLAEQEVASFTAAMDSVEIHVQEVRATAEARGDTAPAAPSPEGQRLAALASADDLPDLVAFTGFVGPKVTRAWGDEETWRLLYLDWRLATWLLVPEDRVYYSDSIEDDGVPGGKRDVIWVDGNAPIKRGSGPRSVEARFLSGEFTRAGDLRESLTGGTFTANTGLFCEAVTASCCGKPTRH